MNGCEKFQGTELIADYGISLLNSKDYKPSEKIVAELRPFIVSFLRLKISANMLREEFAKRSQPENVVSVLNSILSEAINHQEVRETPIKYRYCKLPRHWSQKEDIRLLAGVLINGDTDWNVISDFVGMGRNRPMCNQRWSRTLNPKIRKDSWSIDEEELLSKLVDEEEGMISWTRIAHKLKFRTDVQCRYHYEQMRKKKANEQPSSPEKDLRSVMSIPHILGELILPQENSIISSLPMNVSDFLKCFNN